MTVREHEPVEAAIHRLTEERDEAVRRYNEVLTALDRAALRAPEFPHPPPAYNEQQIAPLNQAWDIGVAAPAARGGLKGRLAGFVWRIAGPPLQKQLAFNALLVEHINRNVEAHRESQKAIHSIVALLREQVADLLTFQSRLLVFLQHVTPYVDTTGRRAEGQALIVNGALNALAGDLAKRWESMVAREQRFEARVSQVSGAHEELRTLVAVSQQAALTMKRELERLTGVKSTNPKSTNPKSTNPKSTTPNSTTPEATTPKAFAPALDAYKYVGFEDQFRGSQETIRARLESYLPYFDRARDVLDVGCGRGEFLDLLQARGVTARGLDLNHEMVEVCRARGLEVTEADAVSYLDGLPDGALGGLFAAQVVEHLQPAYLLRFLELAHHKLRPGAPIVLETLNPACWTAFFDSFIRDITHVWPLHPETLRYLVLASGFPSARIEWRSPVAAQDKLQPVAADPVSPIGDLAETFNANVEKLNARMFTFLDYAIVGTR